MFRSIAVSKGSCRFRIIRGISTFNSKTTITTGSHYSGLFKPIPTNHLQFSRISRSFASFHSAMVDTAPESGVTAELLKGKLTNQLGAQYVEIEDMSGMFARL
jgi:stress-induced morphogen